MTENIVVGYKHMNKKGFTHKLETIQPSI